MNDEDKNNKNNHPLNDALNMNPEQLDEEFIQETDIPEEAQLVDIIKMSLKVYKEIIDDIQFVEVKHKPRHLDVAEKYLNQAKDAIYKREQLLLNREKFESSKKDKDNKSNQEDSIEGKTFDRKELLKEISKGN